MARAFAELVPGQSDRALFVGQTGSGKTTLARVLLATRPYVVVHDSKGTLNWPGYRIVRDLQTLWTDVGARPEKPVNRRVIYRPAMDEADDDDATDDFFRFCYQRRRCTVYVDEVYGVVKQGRPMPHHMRAVLTRGREHGVECWNATQRPTWVPLEVISEAEHVFAFRLKMESDRARVEGFAGIEADAIRALPKFDFLYARQDGDTVGPLRLALK